MKDKNALSKVQYFQSHFNINHWAIDAFVKLPVQPIYLAECLFSAGFSENDSQTI